MIEKIKGCLIRCRVLPCDFNGKLTLIEMVGKMKVKMNELIRNYNEVIQSMQDLLGEFAVVKRLVDNQNQRIDKLSDLTFALSNQFNDLKAFVTDELNKVKTSIADLNKKLINKVDKGQYATSVIAGLVKAKQRTTETVPVAIDPDGTLYVPESSGQGGGGSVYVHVVKEPDFDIYTCDHTSIEINDLISKGIAVFLEFEEKIYNYLSSDIGQAMATFRLIEVVDFEAIKQTDITVLYEGTSRITKTDFYKGGSMQRHAQLVYDRTLSSDQQVIISVDELNEPLDTDEFYILLDGRDKNVPTPWVHLLFRSGWRPFLQGDASQKFHSFHGKRDPLWQGYTIAGQLNTVRELKSTTGGCRGESFRNFEQNAKSIMITGNYTGNLLAGTNVQVWIVNTHSATPPVPPSTMEEYLGGDEGSTNVEYV